MSGTPAPETFVGTGGVDVLCGLGGNDRLEGRGRGDFLFGGTGVDRLLGGDGPDLLDARDGAAGDRLNGGRGRLIGALTGVLLLGILQNVLTLSPIAAFWIDAAYGLIILVALILARVTGGAAGEA